MSWDGLGMLGIGNNMQMREENGLDGRDRQPLLHDTCLSHREKPLGLCRVCFCYIQNCCKLPDVSLLSLFCPLCLSVCLSVQAWLAAEKKTFDDGAR